MNGKRRPRKYHEKLLMFYYYKNKVPVDCLDENFWSEHIFPFSSSYENEIDIDRLGNNIPIIEYLNSKRSNKHISEYRKHDEKTFIKFINDIIPDDNLYDMIINHKEKNPKIINPAEFNNFCEKNEKIYKENFINCLFTPLHI
jgi:hypothetical protein